MGGERDMTTAATLKHNTSVLRGETTVFFA